MNEILEPGYARQPMAMGPDTRGIGCGSLDTALVQFNVSSNWSRVPAFWVITDSPAREAGNAYFWGPLVGSRPRKNGDHVILRKGDLTVNLGH